jgi:acylphosphatase
MVQKMFFIEGENVFDAGFRISLYSNASEYDIKINATNLRKEKKIRVIAAGDMQNIEAFHSYKRNHDIRSIQRTTMYNVRPIKNYTGPKIDWNREELGLISEQISKILNVASTKLGNIDTNIDSMSTKLGNIDTNIDSINTKIEEVDKKFGVIGETLSRIDDKIPQGMATNRESNQN